MEHKLTISPSPHVHSRTDTRGIMRDVCIALLPALGVSIWAHGIMALVVTCVSVAACILFEWLIQRFLIKGPLTINNLSAVVTGILLAFNLPTTLPIWMVILGALVAVGVGKMTFGGLGKNPFNPALVGRVFLLLSFPVAMTTFPQVADAMSGATPLALVKEALKNGTSIPDIMAQLPSWSELAIGFKGGSFGEVSVIALLIGGIYLLCRRVISWRIPVAVLGTMALFTGIVWGIDPEHYMSPVFHLLTGGAMLGAIFMATDYTTSPMSRWGQIVFGVGIGAITILIRLWGAYPEGMSFAILIMNALVPLLDKYLRPKRFGK